jgi:hypothetical protein
MAKQRTRLVDRPFDQEGALGYYHQRIRYFAKILAGGRLGQNSTDVQRELV